MAQLEIDKEPLVELVTGFYTVMSPPPNDAEMSLKVTPEIDELLVSEMKMTPPN
jgi:hypothetical protein